MQKKSTPFKSLIEQRKQLLENVKSSREGAKRAQAAKDGKSDADRKRLEELRKGFAQDRDRAKKDLNELNKFLKVAEQEGKLSAEERRDALELDRELREKRIERAKEIEKKVKSTDGEKFLPGLPTRARIRVTGPDVVGTRKKDVIISGRQGFKKQEKEQKEELERIIEAEEQGIDIQTRPLPLEKPEIQKARFDIPLTEEEMRAGEEKRRERGADIEVKPRKKAKKKRRKKKGSRGRPKKQTFEMELPEDEPQVEIVETRRQGPIFLREPEDIKAEQENMMFLTLDELKEGKR